MDQSAHSRTPSAWPRFDDVPLCLLRRHEGAVRGSRSVAREGWRAWLALHGGTLSGAGVAEATAAATADRAAG